MKALYVALNLALASILASPLLAHSSASAAQANDHSQSTVSPIDVPEAATAAVATIDAFNKALAQNDLKTVEALLDPNVVILEAGGAEHNRAEYFAAHAEADAKFLADAHVTLMRRTARVDGNTAWVASENEVHVTTNGKQRTLLSTETMVLKNTAEGWRIVHIHWSSRAKRSP